MDQRALPFEQAVRAVRVLVVAAGGVGSAEAVAAAIALASDAARHTALTNVFTGRPARSIVTRILAARL